MRALASLSVLLACAALATGCAAPRGTEPAPRGAAWKDVGTPGPAVTLEREVRYYVDEKGIVWDDRGRKHDAALPRPVL